MAEREGFAELEDAVGTLLTQMDKLRKRAAKAEGRLQEAEALLRGFKKGKDDPARLQRRLSDLERENRKLRDRIDEGREGVERLLGRIRFLEEQK